MDPAHADLDVSCLMNISLDMFTSDLPESGYSEQDDYNMTPHSEFSRRQFCSGGSSTDSLTVELQKRTLPDHSSPSSANERKKGQCSKCSEINRMQEKLEGRNCVSCTLEVQEIVETEKECSANQLRPNQISVNGQPLIGKEFAELLGCSNPPLTLRPGRFWYDAQCGYLGKAMVSRICNLVSLPTPKSNVIGALEQLRPAPAYLDSTITHTILLLGHSGCGTSTIMKQAKFISGKDFTSKERQDIKALIQISIFEYIIVLLKARQRFEEERNMEIGKMKERMPSTSDSDDVIKELLKNDYEISAATVKEIADHLLQMHSCGNLEKHYNTEVFLSLDPMWKDYAIQATYERKAEIHMLPDAAGDFLSRVMDIFKDNYLPSHRDILCIEGGAEDCLITEIQFSMDEDTAASRAYYEGDNELLAKARYHLIRISSDIKDRCELLRMFDDVQVLVFCVALDSYGQMWSDGDGSPLQNKMLASRDVFERVSTLPNFKDKPIVLFFNKFDSFQKKLPIVPLTVCEWFSAYQPVKSSEHAADQAYTYIARMFKDHFKRINPNGGRLYMFRLEALEQSSVKDGFQHLKEIIRWEESRRRVRRPRVTSASTTESGSLVAGPPHRG